MKKHPAGYPPRASPEFHLGPSFGFQRDGRRGERWNHELEIEQMVLGSGPFNDISTLTLKIYSRSHYKTLIKRGGCIRGFRGRWGKRLKDKKKKITGELLDCAVG